MLEEKLSRFKIQMSKAEEDIKGAMAQSDIIESLRPLLFVSRVSGYQLFTINVSKVRPEIKIRDIFAICLTVMTNCLVNSTFWISEYNPGIHGIVVMRYSLPILMFFNHIGNVFGMAWVFINRYKIVKILEALSEIDEILIKIGEGIDHVRNKRNLKILVTLPITFICTITSCCCIFHQTNHFRLDFLLQVFSLWIFICTFVLYYHIVAGVSGISQRFVKMCTIMNEISPKNSINLQKVQEIHLKVADAIGIFNKVYGPLMIFYFGGSFCWLCISIFAVAMYPNVNKSTICALMCIVIHCFVTIATCFFIVKLAENVTTYRKKLIKNSYKLINKYAENSDFCGKVLQFQSQVMNVKFGFSCGFFDINWKFVFKASKKQFLIYHCIKTDHLIFRKNPSF